MEAWEVADEARMESLQQFRRDLLRDAPGSFAAEMEIRSEVSALDGSEALPGVSYVLEWSPRTPDGESLRHPGAGWFVYRVEVGATNEVFMVATHEHQPYRILGGPWQSDR